MLPALQPTRPKLQQQDYRHVQQQTRSPATASISGTRHPNGVLMPQSQLEAMPPPPYPFRSPFLNSAAAATAQQYNAATRHPVFFTDRLRRLPFTTSASPVETVSPVVEGYVLEERSQKAGMGGQAKL